MTNQPDNSGEARGAGELNDELQAETLLALAREYFAADFPNPERRDCPDRAAWHSSAQTGRLPDDTLRAHLFGCSECFQEYRTALAVRSVAVPAVAADWRGKLRRLWRPHPGFAWAGAALVLLVISWLGWRGGSVQEAPATPGRPAAAPTTQPTQQAAAAPQHGPPPRAVAPEMLTIVRIDLNEYVALRGATGLTGSQRVIQLAPARLRLQLRLPEGSLAGVYTVSLLDASDRAVATARAVSRDGARLLVALDLRGVRAKNYWLQLQHPAEPPALYPVRVAGRND